VKSDKFLQQHGQGKAIEFNQPGVFLPVFLCFLERADRVGVMAGMERGA
jgi:hypothetical protein